MIVTLLVGLVAAVVSFLMSIVMWKVGIRFKLHPAIRERDVHTRPTPRLGGIAMYLGLLSAMLVAWIISTQTAWFRLVFAGNEPQIIAILCAATLIVVMGVLDDFFDLDWTTKLIGQLIAAGLLAYLGGLQITDLPVGGDIGVLVGSSWSSLTLTLIVIVVVMNMMNFIDGLDGLVAGVAVIANGAFFLYSYMALQATGSASYFSLGTLLSAAMCGACLGFLPLNWHPARLFMGDAGSLLVGLMMAVASIAVTTSITPQLFQTAQGYSRAQYAPSFMLLLLPVAIIIVPVIDFTSAVVRRIAAGKSPFSADRKHLHHRLLDMGHSPLHATLIFYAWTAVVSVGSLLFFVVSDLAIAWSFIGGGLIVCAIATLAPLSHRKRREYAVQAKPVATTTREIAVLDPLDRAGSSPKERSA